MAETILSNGVTQVKTENQCIMDYSSYSNLEAGGRIKNFAVKYVVSGTENYRINGSDFRVEAGEYLLAGFNSEARVQINSKTPATGICIDLSKDILNEVLSFYQNPEPAYAPEQLWRWMSSIDFPENKYKAGDTQLGSTLLKLQPQIIELGVGFIDAPKETYYHIAESVVKDCMHYLPIFERINSIKPTTRKEIFRKLLRARNFMDREYLVLNEVHEIAQQHGFSEYHFFHLFKLVFEISPYQYLLHKRLVHASALLKNRHLTISEVAFASGFGDVHNFSKAFRKKFRISPSEFHRSYKKQDLTN